MKDWDKEIREDWFNDHIATLTQYGDLTVLDWKRPNEIFYYIRYVFDGSKIYISGDLGEAVFWLTWRADIHSFNNIHIGYFTEKLRAFSDERWDYNSDKAVARLKEWEGDLIEYGTKYDKEKMNELIQEAENCSWTSEWAGIVDDYEYNNFISNLDCDYWEWMYNIGNEYPLRLRSYLIGLQMASEQLKNRE